MNMSISKKFCTKSGLEKEATRSRKPLKKSYSITREKKAESIRVLIMKMISKAAGTDTDESIAIKVMKAKPELFSGNLDSVRRMVSRYRSKLFPVSAKQLRKQKQTDIIKEYASVYQSETDEVIAFKLLVNDNFKSLTVGRLRFMVGQVRKFGKLL
jgi:hypothetical protein